jgi:hypothetical protein
MNVGQCGSEDSSQVEHSLRFFYSIIRTLVLFIIRTLVLSIIWLKVAANCSELELLIISCVNGGGGYMWWLCSTFLHCTPLHSNSYVVAVLRCTPLHSIVLHCTPQHRWWLYSTALHCISWAWFPICLIVNSWFTSCPEQNCGMLMHYFDSELLICFIAIFQNIYPWRSWALAVLFLMWRNPHQSRDIFLLRDLYIGFVILFLDLGSH